MTDNNTPTPPRFTPEQWFKSSFSTDDGAGCVEVALSAAAVGLRDTKDRSIPAHTYSSGAWASLLAGVQAGEFDLSDVA